jgi:hypothetical protein
LTCIFFLFQQSYGKTSAYAQYGRTTTNQQQQQQQNPDSDWTNIIPTISDAHPTQHYRNSFTYTGNFVFYGLTPATEYEVIIQSRNKEGWSDPNDIFRFSTRSRGELAHRRSQLWPPRFTKTKIN